MTMRFLANMGISPRTVEQLRAWGHDAVHLYELGLERATDDEIIALARDQGRMVLTVDLDFAALLARSGANEPTVIIFRVEHATPAKLNRLLASLLNTFTEDDLANSIVVVREGQVRIRPLPVGTGRVDADEYLCRSRG